MRKGSSEIDFKVVSRLHKHVGVEGATSKVLVQLNAGLQRNSEPAKFAWDPRGTRNCGRLWPNGATRWTVLPQAPTSPTRIIHVCYACRTKGEEALRPKLVQRLAFSSHQPTRRSRTPPRVVLLGPSRTYGTRENRHLFSSITNKQQIHFHFSFYPYTRFDFLSYHVGLRRFTRPSR